MLYTSPDFRRYCPIFIITPLSPSLLGHWLFINFNFLFCRQQEIPRSFAFYLDSFWTLFRSIIWNANVFTIYSTNMADVSKSFNCAYLILIYIAVGPRSLVLDSPIKIVSLNGVVCSIIKLHACLREKLDRGYSSTKTSLLCLQRLILVFWLLQILKHSIFISLTA